MLQATGALQDVTQKPRAGRAAADKTVIEHVLEGDHILEGDTPSFMNLNQLHEMKLATTRESQVATACCRRARIGDAFKPSCTFEAASFQWVAPARRASMQMAQNH